MRANLCPQRDVRASHRRLAGPPFADYERDEVHYVRAEYRGWIAIALLTPFWEGLGLLILAWLGDLSPWWRPRVSRLFDWLEHIRAESPNERAIQRPLPHERRSDGGKTALRGPLSVTMKEKEGSSHGHANAAGTAKRAG